MEHRYYPRIQLSLDIDLIKRGQLVGSAVTQDLSLGGMTLLPDKSTLYPNDIVLLRIWIKGELQTLRGFVVYTSETRIGIMFIGMSREATRAYFNFLRDMQVPLRAALDESS
ncbi:MAG: PilZ domain-containing protein [Candidatus Thiodiazotropha sp.]